MTTRRNFLQLTTLSTLSAFVGCQKHDDEQPGQPPRLRVGFFPNLTHAQALVGYQETQTKGAEGWFEKATGARIEWMPFTGGPTAIESLLTGAADLTYCGPSPPLNGYTRTRGSDIRIISGSAIGGSGLVVQPGSGLKNPADFRGRRVGSPQLGNTQDIAARAWLGAGGLHIRVTGGDASVLPAQNPDLLDLFKRKQLDGAWVVEPWLSRLQNEAGAELVFDEKDAVTTLITASARAVEKKRALLAAFVAAHARLTEKITADPVWARGQVNLALKTLTSKPIPVPLLESAWQRLRFTTALDPAALKKIQQDAHAAGLLPRVADLGQLFITP